MRFQVFSLTVLLAASQSTAFAGDLITKPAIDTTTKDQTISNPSHEAILGSDKTTLERRVDSGAMSRPIKPTGITHGGDAVIKEQAIHSGAKIAGPSGTVNGKSELPSTKDEVGGGAVGSPAQ